MLNSWFRRKTHKLFCPVNRPVVPGSTGPSPEQKVHVDVPFSLPKFERNITGKNTQRKGENSTPRREAQRLSAMVPWDEPFLLREYLSRPDPCSVVSGRETPKFWFQFCCVFWGWIFSSCFFFQGKRPQNIHRKKSPAKFTWNFVRKNSPRISAETFSWVFFVWGRGGGGVGGSQALDYCNPCEANIVLDMQLVIDSEFALTWVHTEGVMQQHAS